MKEIERLTNVDVVVYALAVLGGAEKTVYSEEIAVKCYELAPKKFSWQLPHYKDKEWPDKYIVKTALEDAKKKKYGSLVEGRYALETTKDGWRLTHYGVKWFKMSKTNIENVLGTARSLISKKDKEEYIRTIRALSKHHLYKHYIAVRSLQGSTVYQLTDMLNCSPDAPSDLIKRKFTRLLVIAELMDNDDIRDFLHLFYSAFPQLELDIIQGEEE